MRVRFWFNLINCSWSFQTRAIIGEPSCGTEKSPAHLFLSVFLQSSGFVSIQFALFPSLLPSPFNTIKDSISIIMIVTVPDRCLLFIFHIGARLVVPCRGH